MKSRNSSSYSVQILIFSTPKNFKIKINKIIILSVVLYGCETLGVGRMLKVFENMVLKRKFGSKKDKNVEI